MLGSKKNSHHFFSSIKNAFILAFRIINLQNTSQPLISLTTDANPDGKWCLTASKLIKESEEHMFCKKKLLLLLCIVYSIWLASCVCLHSTCAMTGRKEKSNWSGSEKKVDRQNSRFDNDFFYLVSWMRMVNCMYCIPLMGSYKMWEQAN